MSPPKVSLSGKEPLKTDSDELPSEKGDGAEFPSVIIVETEHRARNFRQAKRKRCKLIICAVTLVITVAVAALLTLTIVNVLRRYHRKESFKCNAFKGQSTNVHVDNENQLIRASHDHDDQSETVAFEILHEYTRHLIAYKDVDNNTCYVDRLDETFLEGYRRWKSYESGNKETQALKVISKPIEVEVLRHIGDTNIYGHCGNATTVWVMAVEKTEVTIEDTVIYV